MSQRAMAAPGMIGFLSRRRGWWRLMLLGVILLIMAGYVSPVHNYLEKSGAIQREQAITGDLRHQHEELLQEKENLLNNNFVEQVARKDLGMVKPGEQPYVVKDLNTYEDAVVAELPAEAELPLIDRILNAFASLIP